MVLFLPVGERVVGFKEERGVGRSCWSRLGSGCRSWPG
jgi:hypothetical protein